MKSFTIDFQLNLILTLKQIWRSSTEQTAIETTSRWINFNPLHKTNKTWDVIGVWQINWRSIYWKSIRVRNWKPPKYLDRSGEDTSSQQQNHGSRKIVLIQAVAVVDWELRIVLIMKWNWNVEIKSNLMKLNWNFDFKSKHTNLQLNALHYEVRTTQLVDIQFWLCIDCAHGINISLLWSDLICQRIEFRVAPLNDSMKTMWATIFPQKNRSFQSYRQSKFLNYFARWIIRFAQSNSESHCARFTAVVK